MKLNLFGVFTLCSFVFSLVSCDKEAQNESVHEFKLESTEWEVSLERDDYFPILSGNGEYTIKVEDQRIVTADFNNMTSSADFGYFKVNPLRKGETIISVTDNISQTTIDIKVKVVNGYAGAIVSESDLPAFPQKCAIYFIKNEAQEVYFFETDQISSPARVMAKGKYEFTEEENMCYMKLLYATDENGKLTDAAIAPQWHTFDITGSDIGVFQVLRAYLGIDWKRLTGPRADLPSPYFMYAQEEESDCKITIDFAYARMILKGVIE